MNEPTAKDDGWPRGWEGHELAQLRYWKQLPLAEKLAWLEEAHKLAMHLNRQPDKSKGPPS
jgi:hypothetical protein